MPVELAPNERYAFVAKSRSGKTTLATLLAVRIIPRDPNEAKGWENWWVDTKGDPRDHQRLYSWGYHDWKNGPWPRRLIKVPFEENNSKITVDSVNEICYKALKRGGVLLTIDEYRHVCPSRRTLSPGLLHVFQRGGGLDVGVIGQTQEPVDVPRQLISQASHIILGNLTYPYDIDFAKSIYPYYRPPMHQGCAFPRCTETKSHGDKYGFYWGWVDGDGVWRYHPHQKHWDMTMKGLLAPA